MIGLDFKKLKVFQEIHEYIKPYKNNVRFHDKDEFFTDKFLTGNNKVIICSQIGDLGPCPFTKLIPFLETAKEKNNFYIYLTHTEPSINLDKYKDVSKFIVIPSFHAWYTKFLEKKPIEKNIKKHFLSTNNRYFYNRLALFYFFFKNNLLEKSYFSYIGNERVVNLVDDLENNIMCDEFDLHLKDLINIDEIKNLIPYSSIPGDLNSLLDDCGDWSLNLYPLYNESFLSIVAETYFHNPPFFTEKIWKPIAMKQPFLLMGSQYSLKFLRDMGFKTFDSVIDESYDLLYHGRFAAIFNEIKRIANFSIPELIEMNKMLEGVLEHNYNHFYNVLPEIYQIEINKVGKEIVGIIENHLKTIT